MQCNFFVILSIHKPSLVSCDVQQKFWPDRFSGYKKTNRQAKYLNRYIQDQITNLFIFNIPVSTGRGNIEV